MSVDSIAKDIIACVTIALLVEAMSMPKTQKPQTLEACHMGAMSTKMDKRSMTSRRVMTMKMASILVELTLSRRVMMLMLSCLLIMGQS